MYWKYIGVPHRVSLQSLRYNDLGKDAVVLCPAFLWLIDSVSGRDAFSTSIDYHLVHREALCLSPRTHLVAKA